MRKYQLIIFPLLFVMSCGAPVVTGEIPTGAVMPVETATQPQIQIEPTASITPEPLIETSIAPTIIEPATTGTTLYISGTMHIESKSDSWPPDVEAFLAFLEETTNAGMRWSIGADVGWLENGVRVQEIVQRANTMGVQWDVHAHEASDRAKAAYLLTQYGVTPTSVVSGMQIDEFDGLAQQLTYQGYTWTPQVIWGGANCVGHRPGCDDTSIALYRPTSTAQYKVHDPNGALIRVGNTDHQLATAGQLLSLIAAGQYTVPILSFTIMVEPEVLQIVNSEDGLAELLAFIEGVKQNPSVHFGTIEETAQAWVDAGSVAIQIP